MSVFYKELFTKNCLQRIAIITTMFNVANNNGSVDLKL